MMIQAGLVSVTFRQHSPAEIIDLARRAGLACIEWGGDVHVPHGDLRRAREVREMTCSAGLRVSSYGSYYRVWPVKPCPFETVIETALELGAPLVRVWAGELGSAQASAEHRRQVADEAQRIAALATADGLAVAFEYHNGTLTDTSDSALVLMKDAGASAHPNLGLYWQPRAELSVEVNLAALRAVLPWLRGLHVFHWLPDPRQHGTAPRRPLRRPLGEGASDWNRYLSVVQENGAIAASTGGLCALIDFVLDDSDAALLDDAAVLKGWLGEISPDA
jgi:sugar phosphate isomerase/epimerase